MKLAKFIYHVFLALFVFICPGCGSVKTINEDGVETYPWATRHDEFTKIGDYQSLQSANSIYSDQTVAQYLDEFVIMWEGAALPGAREELVVAFDNLEIHWQQSVFSDPSVVKYPVLEGLTLVGRSISGRTQIFANDQHNALFPSLGKTCLGHELIHVALYTTTGDIAADHFGNEETVFPPEYEKFKEDLNGKF